MLLRLVPLISQFQMKMKVSISSNSSFTLDSKFSSQICIKSQTQMLTLLVGEQSVSTPKSATNYGGNQYDLASQQ